MTEHHDELLGFVGPYAVGLRVWWPLRRRFFYRFGVRTARLTPPLVWLTLRRPVHHDLEPVRASQIPS